MSTPSTFSDTPNAISSPASASGPLQLDLLDGLTIGRSGPDHAPANRSRSRASRKDLPTSATSGPYGETLSPSDALQSFMESRLRQRLTGSELCEVIWKPWVTPWGARRFKPRARVRTISATDTGLWPTVRASDGEKGGPNQKFGAGGQPLPAMVAQASAWPTPTTRDHKDGHYQPNVPVNGLLGKDGLAHTDQPCASEGREQRGGEQRGPGGDQETCDSGDMADCEGIGSHGRAGSETQGHWQSQQRSGDHDFDWVIGADGKSRRVKPGIRLLVDGHPNRVAKLRAFGNAIDPRPAAQWIGAFLDCEP